ncbi:hypothetical protein ZHAS_00015745 [Anopheles sinensis]|uniref:Uncharacterized protein n=1 Tax=Anopheles sinensis TaxID=74873 RepID=A0A084WBV3_ANOSI|nr:hypothetical protein ZHAS_00015745 [Anopheles sinensis]
MESSEKSENKIKEKLNLHVKKRLQESTKDSPRDETDLKDKPNSTFRTSGPRSKRQKIKNGSKQTTSSTAAAVPTIPAHGIKNELLLSPGAANSNDTTNSSINSTDQDGELNDREACDPAGSTDKPPKTGQRMDIFSCILNQKKSSLMRDPEVISFLQALVKNKK